MVVKASNLLLGNAKICVTDGKPSGFSWMIRLGGRTIGSRCPAKRLIGNSE